MISYYNCKAILIVFIAFSITVIYRKSINEVLVVEKCPFCLGTSLCLEFAEGRLRVFNSDIILKTIFLIKHIFAVDCVIFASWNSERVVIKQLVYHSDIDELVSLERDALKNEASILESSKVFLNTPFNSTLSPKLRLCPSSEKLEILLNQINLFGSKLDSLINIWYMIHFNSEPFIQQILKAEDDWPVPKYLGSCGRAFVSEYCGKMLTDSVGNDWIFRKNVAYQLLESAFNFTFNHPHFAFYLTDITPDNIAVTLLGKVKFIDLDNIIIVEKITSVNLPSWSVVHVSDDIVCDECFAFSSDDVCSHQISDHNVYAVCREILSPTSYLIKGGLLHSAPKSFLKEHPDFQNILSQCIKPKSSEYDRFYFARILMKILS